MLAQFQSLYPQGSLISELVQIFQGKYIVRASVQIEGVTRATGMAAAETVEAAEDQAITRALIVLGITNAPPESVTLISNPVSPVQLNPSLNTKGGFSEPTAYSSAKNEDFVSSQWPAVSDKEISIPPSKERNIKPEVVTNSKEQYGYSNAAPLNDTYSQDLGQNFPMTANRELEFDPPVENLEINFDNQPENQTFPAISANNVTPFTPRSYSPQENATTPSVTGKRKKKAEPVDLSDVIAKTDVELQRLGWTPEQGREHLIETYGKRGRTLLTEEELHGFLKYLQSQPDPIAGF
ncbi:MULTISPECIES: hypothetical protein [unclassified Nostoc]|uniref:hypothetical protein n=1 Tax=unclassified Nostoc TaxID=2593658 RepID=UPI0025AAD2F1|nr:MULTISPECIES: hypothetical protein [unclassified Nostoc]MDM9583336.1 hypothetical protein [Nostoc sp. GT001]MDZ7947746.1 hypothetical protein [Nostoc sp. EfeVER01]MDZ7993579.1 hypothetical protein [Nostoc sp. EspVER01]